MRIPLALVAFGALGAMAVAQTPVNNFHVYTGRTSFTSRAFLGGAAGETLQGYPAAQYRGVGDNGVYRGPKTCMVYGLGMIAQDQNNTTPETYWVVLRNASMTGEPDGSAGGLIAEFGPFDLPTGTSGGAAAWSVTIDFGTDGVRVPCKGDNFYAGIRLSENLGWTSDGQSTHASAYTDPVTTNGDPVIAGAPSWAYQVDATGASRATNPRSWNYWLQTQRGAFQIGCIQGTDKLFGNCGNYPDVTIQGLAFRVRDEASANASFVLFVADSLTGGPPLPIDGHLWLNPGGMMMIDAGTLDSDGVVEITPAGFGPGELAAYFGMGNMPFQVAILIGAAERFPFRMTNAQASSL